MSEETIEQTIELTQREINNRIYDAIQAFVEETYPKLFLDDGLKGTGITSIESAVLARLLAYRARFSNCEGWEQWETEWLDMSKSFIGLGRE